MSSPAPTSDATGPDPRTRLPRLAQDAVDRARLRVVPRPRTQAARVPFVGLISLVLVTGVVGLLLFNTSMQQASFATTALEQQAGTLSAREQTLRMQLAQQRDPQRVARRAQELGMVIPAVPAFLSLGTGEVSGRAAPASAADRFAIEAPRLRNPYASRSPQRSRTGASSRERAAGRDRNEAQASRSDRSGQARQTPRSLDRGARP